MKQKYFFILLLIILSNTVLAQEYNSIKYSVQLKKREYNEDISNYSVIGFSFLDSATIEYLAKTYVKVLFAKENEELLSVDDMYRDIQEIPDLLDTSGKMNNNSHYIKKNDTIFFKDNNKTIPYISKSGHFDIYIDTITIEDPETGEIFFEYKPVFYDLIKQFAGFRFYENWSFDSKKGIFKKQINNIIPYIAYTYIDEEYDYSNIRYRRLECYFVQKQSKNTKPLVKNIVYDINILPTTDYDYDYIDYDYCLTQNRNKIILEILKAVKNKKIKAYQIKANNTLAEFEPDFSKKLDYKNLINKLSYLDVNKETKTDTSIDIKQKRYTFNTSLDTVYNYKLGDIFRFRFYEDWYFDENTFTIQKKVKGIVFIVAIKKLNAKTKKYDLILQPKAYFKFN